MLIVFAPVPPVPRLMVCAPVPVPILILPTVAPVPALIVTFPEVPVAFPEPKEASPELEVVPDASPDLMVSTCELVLAADVSTVPILELVVSTLKMLVPAAFWIWKAVVESVEFLNT